MLALAEIALEAYLALTAGQGEIGFESLSTAASQVVVERRFQAAGPRPRVRVDEADLAAHEARLAKIRGKAGRCVWDALEAVLAPELVPA